MDEKQVYKKYLLISFCLFLGMISCQKKEEVVSVIDEDNSQFAGKLCYGSSIPNQYVLGWSDGSYSLFKGTKENLNQWIQQRSVQEQKNPIAKRLRSAEQNRKFNWEHNLKMQQEVQSKGNSFPGSFWQVWGQADTQVDALWEKNIKGAGIIVAVIDGGVDQSHPSLMNRIYVNKEEIPNNGVDDDQNGLVDDDRGFDFSSGTSQGPASDHGTHVAGIIAAEPKESPMLGLAPESQILPISIFGGPLGGDMESAILALKYAESRGAHIVNASWGGAVCAETIRDAILSLSHKDILFVTASGNGGFNIEQEPEYPASFNLENQITVGANMPSGLMASFSNYGYHQVHVLAPGHQILSTVPGGWAIMSGTSMAAPFVSGLAALLWSAYPESTSIQIKKAILQSVKIPKDYTPVLSKGRINAVQALEKLELQLKASQKP